MFTEWIEYINRFLMWSGTLFEFWTYVWFQNFITWCRKWTWFDTYIYGKSTSLEDFCRNPGEVFRDTYFPFIIKNVKSYSVFNLRCGYLSALNNPSQPNCWLVPMGMRRKYIWEGKKWAYADLRVLNPWYTKFCNAAFFLQFAISLKYYIPIPYVSMCIKIAPWYFQFGLGWGPEVVTSSGQKNCAVLCAKLRLVNEKTSNEAILNNTDIKGYFEGTI